LNHAARPDWIHEINQARRLPPDCSARQQAGAPVHPQRPWHS